MDWLIAERTRILEDLQKLRDRRERLALDLRLLAVENKMLYAQN